MSSLVHSGGVAGEAVRFTIALVKCALSASDAFDDQSTVVCICELYEWCRFVHGNTSRTSCPSVRDGNRFSF